MKTFELTRAERQRASHRCSGEGDNSATGRGNSLHRAAGTTLIDLMKLNVETAAKTRRREPAAARQNRGDLPMAA